MNLKAGVVLQKGKYTIDSILGQGGFGITYRAIHHQFNQIVVLKTLNESLRQHQDFAKFQYQFIAEAHLLANSRHPNIVKVWDCFEEEQLFFMVMDYIPGQNLAELIQSGHNLDPKQATHYIHQIASALSVVHKNGFLHRDIQPKNIIRRAGSNTVVLTDFGMACDLTPGIRQTHTNLFSVGYSPPEQCNPEQKLGPATDIYALTATLYYLLTGNAPTPAALRLSQAIPQTLKFSAKELKDFQPNLTPCIENTILMGLEIDAEKRPQTVESWLGILLNESNILKLKKQNSYLPEIASKFNNNDKLMELKSESSIHQKKGNYLTNEAQSQTVNKKNIEVNNFQFFSPSDTDLNEVRIQKSTHPSPLLGGEVRSCFGKGDLSKAPKTCSRSWQGFRINYFDKFSWINQLSFQLAIFLLFVLTAGTFGWIGFNLTLRYSYAKNNNKIASLTSNNLLENLKQEQNYTFRNHDPSSPLFGSPSVKTYSINPPKLNKLPKPYFEQDEFFPNSLSVSNQDDSWSENPNYSADMKTQVFPYNYSSNENSVKVDLPKTSYYPSDYQPLSPKYQYQKYQQQNQYPDDYY
ncbi:MAG: serine/threonine protein kinase [Okeania sp. SIO3I5]|nr:serine/threonine protein kinase [Okeania sp. SIO3I5]